MSHITNIKNLASSFQKMRLVLEMQTALAGDKKEFLALAIKTAIENKKPCDTIINDVKYFAKDNYNLVADILGLKLTDQILNFE